MPTDKQPEDRVTDAGAVELEETQLDDAAGGIIAVAPAPELAPMNKYSPEVKLDPSYKLDSPIQKVR